ncbi:MAG: aminotransferase class I/II-fold pyridoxal phosphate-dependent enzyme [Cyanobacteria bacterium SIG30]|nr:aminotransferase class I/II-fold pyridoxal phosphate-dependent enzyme [Cyanobacteria bacterium SIG30]
MEIMKKFNNYVQSLETYIMFQIKARMLELTDELTKKNRKPIALSMGAPTDMVPEYAVQKLRECLDDPKIHTYTIPKGETYFLEAVAKRMKNRFGVEMNPKTEVFSLIGSKEGIANLIRELINPTIVEKEKDIILIPNPGYASYKEMVKVSGGLAYSVPLTKENNYMPNLDKVLEQLIKDGYDSKKVKALIINYPNNPLGCVCTKEYMQHCVDFCIKNEIILIADNAYCDIYFNEEDKPISIFNCEGAKEVAIEFYSFSKPYAMTGWRMGYACGNSEIVGMLGKLKSTIDTGIFKALQLVGAELINSKEGDEYIAQANAKFKNKITKFVKGLNELGFKVDVPKAGFYLWIEKAPKYKTSKEFCDALLEKSGIVAVPGNAFGDLGEGWVRLSITADEQSLDEVIRRMKEDNHRFE